MAYTPASNTTGTATLGHLASVFYKKKGLDRLQKKFLFRDATMKDMISKQSGKTAQWFRYSNLSAVTTATTEGTVGTGVSPTSKIVSATVSQYSSFLTVSDLLQDTAIDPVVQNFAELLGYQAGLSVDNITRAIIDAESTSTAWTMLSAAATMRVADLRGVAHTLQASDVEPQEDGNFYCIMHPYVSFDLVNDPAAGGLADILKYNTNVQSGPLVKREDRGTVTYVAGCKVVESTNVKTLTGPNRYRAYVFGKNGVGSLDLEGRGPSNIVDPSKERFKVNVINGSPSIADPEGVIGAAVSYNFIFAAVVLEGPTGIGGTFRYKTLDAQSTIG